MLRNPPASPETDLEIDQDDGGLLGYDGESLLRDAHFARVRYQFDLSSSTSLQIVESEVLVFVTSKEERLTVAFKGEVAAGICQVERFPEVLKLWFV